MHQREAKLLFSAPKAIPVASRRLLGLLRGRSGIANGTKR
jgi:hypothetical protein